MTTTAAQINEAEVQKLEAELVAVSDKYMSADEIPPALRGKSAQIWQEDGECKAAPL